jgi:hypothetical protein
VDSECSGLETWDSCFFMFPFAFDLSALALSAVLRHSEL